MRRYCWLLLVLSPLMGQYMDLYLTLEFDIGHPI